MHKYLRSIGFSKIKSRHQLEDIYAETLSSPDKKTCTLINADTTLIQLDKNFGDGIGLTLIGELSSEGNLSIEHYFPYSISNSINKVNDITVEKHSTNESYSGIIDTLNMSTIFYVQNIADFSKLKWYNKVKRLNAVVLSAFSTEGRILIPIIKTDADFKRDVEETRASNILYEKAKKGDMSAIQKLAVMDDRLKNNIVNRLSKEDILSIVDTSLIPYGVECECYELIGTIMSYKIVENTTTKEKVYKIEVLCNNFFITICINEKDLTGEPDVGRRFKGIVWLSGFLMI